MPFWHSPGSVFFIMELSYCLSCFRVSELQIVNAQIEILWHKDFLAGLLLFCVNYLLYFTRAIAMLTMKLIPFLCDDIALFRRLGSA